MYQLYKAYGKYTPFVYYGYCSSDLHPLSEFISQAKRASDRGASKLLIDNNNELEAFDTDVLEVYENELDAFIARNDERARDPLAITGPSHFPGGVAERAAKERPGKVAMWKTMEKYHNMKTAREAYQDGAFAYKNITSLAQEHGRDTINADLTQLDPARFSAKYNLVFQLPGAIL